MKGVDLNWFTQTKGKKYPGNNRGNLTEDWVVGNDKELLLVLLVMIIVLWLYRQMSLLFRGEYQDIHNFKTLSTNK